MTIDEAVEIVKATPDHGDGDYREALRLVLADRDRLRKKCDNSLANNLCPGHRDKQAGKPCLACEVERLREALQPFVEYHTGPTSAGYPTVSDCLRAKAALEGKG